VWAGTAVGVAGAFSVAAAQPRLAENCRVFASTSRQQLQAAVATANSSVIGEPRVFFADPGFGRDDAIFAPRSKLFGISVVSLSWPDPILTPVDPVAALRRLKCDSCTSVNDPEQLMECYRASIGHPSEDGARVYARVIFDLLTTGGQGLIWADFSAPCSTVAACGNGSWEAPWGSLPFAIADVPEGGTIRIKSSARPAPGALTISKPCLIESCGGSSIIGN
jgi:hypothetical protein